MMKRKFVVILVSSNLVTAAVTALALLLALSGSNVNDSSSSVEWFSVSRRSAMECCACPTEPPTPPSTPPPTPPDTPPPTTPPTTPPPTSSTRFRCPDEESSLDLAASAAGNLIELIIPSDGLCTLTKVTPDGFIKPMARSYDSNDWEASAGEFSSLGFTCSSTVCSVMLPDLDDDSVYRLTSFDAPVLYNGDKDEIARFLEQATFGPTRAALESLSEDATAAGSLGLALAEWIYDQQQPTTPITSHRAIYRKLLNARMEIATRQGPVTHPCKAGSRYRRFAFGVKDNRKYVDITTVGNKRILRVDGFVRTVVNGPILSYWDDTVEFTDGSYEINWLSHETNFLGGSFFLYHPDRTDTYYVGFSGMPGNPPINFDSSIGANPNILVTLSSAAPIDIQYFQYEDVTVQELILTEDLDDAVCDSLGPVGNPVNPVFAMYNGSYWIHDPRFKTIENTLESPAPDGGGSFERETTNVIQPDLAAQCSNAPRTFLNEEHCHLSFEPTACKPKSYDDEEEDRPDFWLQLDHQTIRDIYEVTGNGAETTRYLYAMDGLRFEQDADARPPCERTRSRWIPIACTGAATNNQINEMFGSMLSWNDDENPNMRDIWNWWDEPCPARFTTRKGFEVQDLDGNCWLNVHPDYLSVYDMTSWTRDHPGGPNPIKQFAENGLSTLTFPSWHEMTRWANNKWSFGRSGRLGDWVHYYDLPDELRSQALSEFFGFTADAIQHEDSDGVLVCGSPFEVENDPMLGGSQGRGAFDSLNWDFATTNDEDFIVQKRNIWTKAAFEATDQLRQRVAWALSQILVISPDAIDEGLYMTEPLVAYYDIFVRNAFGSYFDILKEVSYSPLMADMLTYYGSQSTAYIWDVSSNLEFADENYAREIMQLFSTGLFKLNMDGTQVKDSNGDPIRVYTNDDIVEYARVWTGFVSREGRGNVETSYWWNQLDPLMIEMEYRDVFPKMGLDRRYVGDGYPLCADLPDRHFLKKGATYRLLGKTSTPDLLWDPDEWESDPAAVRLSLQANGQNSLFAKLCGSANSADCEYPAKVVLTDTLPCNGSECDVDTVRVVEVGDGVFYEYIRPPCVYQAFYDNAKMVVRRWDWWRLTCADPRTQVASVACCGTYSGFWNDVYWGERTTYAEAQQRCNQANLCDRWPRPDCEPDDTDIGSYCDNEGQFWTDTGCTLRVKIDGERNVAIIHDPHIDDLEEREVSNLVRPESAKTFFRVDWSDTGVVDDIIANCGALGSCSTTTDGMCMCDVTVSDEQVFVDGDTPSKEEVLEVLHIGAFDPSTSDSSLTEQQIGDVTIHKESGQLSSSSVFEVVTDVGVTTFRKNVRSTVQLAGTNLSFRNPVHFISLSDPELRDAQDETDAALEHYFYHPNTAPFLAIRLAQRFGISNASPRYIQEIATAFKTGSYSHTEGGTTVTYGSGKYGCMAATMACVLLDREARSVALDVDPSFGSLKEPLLKVVGLMKALEFELNDDVDFLQFDFDAGQKIGQMVHEIPSVFSYFLPEYAASGPVAQGSLVSPEAQVLTGQRLIDSLNGLFSLIKFGYTECFGGLAPVSNWWEEPDCEDFFVSFPPNNEGITGRTTYTPSASSEAEALNELATLLTAGRLSSDGRELISSLVAQEWNNGMKLIKAQQLMVAAPEFHITNRVRRTGNLRPALQSPPPSSNPYKAVVYVLLDGGADTFNMLAPHSCSATNSEGHTLLQQYYNERTTIAMSPNERSRIINAAGQPCSQFAIHQDLEIVERLYKQGDLSFFANAGVINRPVTKDNYWEVTKTQLFAHNAMQEEAQKIDPFDGSPGTGVLGRMCDILNSKGFNAQPITVEEATVATVGAPGAGADPLFVTSYESNSFLPKPDSDTFDARPYIDQLNGEAEADSSVFAETYSARLQKAVHDNEILAEALESTQLNVNFADTDYSQKLRTVSTLLASHSQRGTDRDVFYLSLGGWDNHANLKRDLASNFQELNEALSSFYDEMVSQGLWDDVTLAITSDFARTLTANSGEGSDHAWGGNYFAMGGAVKGGLIHGDYPADITPSGPLNIGRGRLIPTMSWESILNSVVEWMGADTEADKDYCLPNRIQTGTELFTAGQVFD